MRVNFWLIGLCMVAGNLSAHSIFVDCKDRAEAVTCQASFSDGSSAENLPFEVISYEDEPLLAGNTDSASAFVFARPQSEFYILLDAGPGHVVEVDMEEIEAE